MNYHCSPDLDPKQDLTVDAVSLFQRFQQEADRKTVDDLLQQELARHLKLWELAILHAASADMYWCDLPRHPIHDFDVWARRHLEKMGFEVEFSQTAQEETLPARNDSKKTLKVVVARLALTAKWSLAKQLNEEAVAAEWRRRERLESDDLVQNPPERRSRGIGGDFDGGDTVWAAVIDRKFIVEVQRRNQGACLCLFGVDGKCLHVEPTALAFGEVFGADVSDVAGWQDRAQQLVDGWQATHRDDADVNAPRD
jgi:hypothetical protein